MHRNVTHNKCYATCGQFADTTLDFLRDKGFTKLEEVEVMPENVRFGLPPEKYWRYEPTLISAAPEPFLFSFADDYTSLLYVRLDAPGQPVEQVLATVIAFLAAGFPCVFGFTVCTAVTQEPQIPFPTLFDGVRGGQAVMAVGFDDNRTLDLQGAHSAAPIWAEFMKRALQYRAYRNAKRFEAPDGIVSVEIDPQSGMPATPFCPFSETR
jgi:hypothetical protein